MDAVNTPKVATLNTNQETWHSSDDFGWLGGERMGERTSAGVYSTPSKALTTSTVFACVRVIAEDVAKLPLILYRDIDGGKGKERARDEPLYQMMHLEPNAEMGAFDYKQAIMVSAALHGNGYAEIIRRSGFVDEQVPLEPWMVRVERDENRKLIYRYRDPYTHQFRTIQARDMIHVKGLSPNGLLGWMVASVGKEAVGLAIAGHEFTSSYFANGASSSGVLSLDRAMGKDEFEGWVKAVRGQYEGRGNQHKMMVFDNGATFQPVSNNPENSQLIETLQFSVEDVARYFRVSPQKLFDRSRAQGWSTLEITNIDHLTDSLLPWLTRFEEECNRKLLTAIQRQSMFFEFLIDALLRADSKTRYEVYAIALDKKIMNQNEVRRLENLNPVEGGDDFAAETPQQQASPQLTPNDPGMDTERLKAQMMPVFADAAGRVVDREIISARRKSQNAETLKSWASGWYEKQTGYVVSALQPACQTLAAFVGRTQTHADAVVQAYAERHVTDSLQMIDDAVATGINQELDRWHRERGAWIAEYLTNEVCNAQ